MRVGEPFLSCLLTAGISLNYYALTILSLPHTMHSAMCVYREISLGIRRRLMYTCMYQRSYKIDTPKLAIVRLPPPEG